MQAGYPYSLIKHGLLFNYPKLNKNLETDVLVVGGGISGALVAWHLVKRGIVVSWPTAERSDWEVPVPARVYCNMRSIQLYQN